VRGKDLVIVATTVGTEELALAIGQGVVHKRLATCVNIFPNIRSIYRWKGKVCDDGEFLLFIKTLASEIPAVTALIRRYNSEYDEYELPEVLVYPIGWAEPEFAAWWRSMVAKPSRRKTRRPATTPRKKKRAAAR
jgi:periplasmic divalent cation tolerance protein